MKLVAKYIGRLIEYNEPPAPSHALLKDTKTGNVQKVNVVSEKLGERGITEPGAEFEVVIMEDEQKNTTATMSRLETPQFSEAEITAVKELDSKLGNVPEEFQPPPPSEAEKERIKKLEERIKELEAMLGKKP